MKNIVHTSWSSTATYYIIRQQWRTVIMKAVLENIVPCGSYWFSRISISWPDVDGPCIFSSWSCIMRRFIVPTKFSLKIYKLLSKGRPPRKWYVAIVKKTRISTTTSIYEWKVFWNATTTILPNMNKNKTSIYNYAEYELESFAMNSSLTSSKPFNGSKRMGLGDPWIQQPWILGSTPWHFFLPLMGLNNS